MSGYWYIGDWFIGYQCATWWDELTDRFFFRKVGKDSTFCLIKGQMAILGMALND